jgi:hypothetical protein
MYMGSKKLILIASVILILASVFIYGKTAGYELVNSDDYGYVLDNPYIKELSAKNLKDMFTESYYANYQPLVHLTYAMDYKITGTEASSYHTTNIALHTINCVLVLILIFAITKNAWLSIIIAFLFCVHPMQVESVAWISERKGLLCTFFYIPSLLFYIRFSRTKISGYYYLSIALFILALLSKPMAVTLPIILLLFDYHEENLTRAKFIEKVPFFLLSAAFSVITVFAQRESSAINTEQLYSALNFLFAFHNIGFYIGKLVLPISLSAHYEYPMELGYLSYEFASSIMVIIALIVYLKNIRRIDRTVNFGILFFLIGILPILRFVSIGLTFAADRYMYVPMIGFYLAIAGLLYPRLAGKTGLKRILAVLAAGYLVTLGTMAGARCNVWTNNFNFWSDIRNKYPDSKYVLLYYTDALLTVGKKAMGKNDRAGAIERFTTIIDYYPGKKKYDDVSAGVKGTSFDEIGLKRDMIDYYALKIKEKAAYHLGTAYLYENRLAEAQATFDAVILQFPENADAYMQLGNVNDMRGDFAAARKFYEKSIMLKPDNAPAHFNYAVALENNGNIKEARKHFKLASEYDTDWKLPIQALRRLPK